MALSLVSKIRALAVPFLLPQKQAKESRLGSHGQQCGVLISFLFVIMLLS